MTTLLTGNKVGHIGSLTSVGAVLVALLILSGCGGFSYNYSKPGGSQQQHAQDNFECKQASRQPYIVGTGGMLVGGSSPTWETHKECLEARGYTVTVVSEGSAPSRPAAATTQTTPDAFANIMNAEDMQKNLDSYRQYLDRKVAARQLTQEEADGLYQVRKEFLTKRLNISESSVSTPLGTHCVASNTTIGTQVGSSDDKMVKVTTLYGNSPRCSDPATPILVDVEEVGEGESSVSATQSKQDSAVVQFNLGVQYANGNGVPQDYAMARQWYEKAAAQGNAVAQNNLGVLYQNGQGVPQDYVQARQWYEKAAAQGNALAQNNLGMLYANGNGVPQDYAKARGWYEQASAQGNAVAQTNLGVLYEQSGQLTVFLKPRTDQNAAPQPSERAVKVKLATVTDDRQQKGRIGTRDAAFGISMGDVHLGQKAAETMQQALSDDLLAAGYRVVETGQDLIAEGRLRKFWVRTDTTVLYWDVVGDIEFELAVLPTTQKKEPVEKTFTCHQVERTYLWPSATLLGKVLDACLADMMLRVRTDDIWKQAVNY